MQTIKVCIVCGAIYLEEEEVSCGHNTIIVNCSDDEMVDIKKKIKLQRTLRGSANV